MTATAAWFLVFIGGQQWIGPLTEQTCKLAEVPLHQEGIVCRQASAYTVCPDPSPPSRMSMVVCPLFDFPKVTVKP